jgi:hypothetical protein
VYPPEPLLNPRVFVLNPWFSFFFFKTNFGFGSLVLKIIYLIGFDVPWRTQSMNGNHSNGVFFNFLNEILVLDFLSFGIYLFWFCKLLMGYVSNNEVDL